MSLYAHTMGGKLGGEFVVERKAESSFVRTDDAQILCSCLPDPLSSSSQEPQIRLSGTRAVRFQCSQRSFMENRSIRFVFHFRRSQAHHQVTSVVIIQDTFKDDGFYLKHLQPGPIMLLRSSIEATSDDPVRLHDRHNNPNLVSIDMVLLPI